MYCSTNYHLVPHSLRKEVAHNADCKWYLVVIRDSILKQWKATGKCPQAALPIKRSTSEYQLGEV